MAKQPPVKCVLCKQTILRDGSMEFVNLSTAGYRYAHKECAKAQEEKQVVHNQIHTTVQRYLGSSYSRSKVENQINAMLKEGKTEIGILKAIEYWYEIKKGDPAKALGGIGIVRSIYGEAADYYQKLEEIKKVNKNIDLSKFIAPEVENYQFKPKPFRKPKRVKLFDLK